MTTTKLPTVQEISAASDFQAKLRERVLGAFVEMIPQELLTDMVNKEVKAFFESEQVVSFTGKTIEVTNSNYNPRVSDYGNPRTISTQVLSSVAPMTPFRQLVWTTCHEHLKPILKGMMESEHTEVGKEFAEWRDDVVSPDLSKNYKELFGYLTINMSQMMFNQVMRGALQTAHFNMLESLKSTGVNVSMLPTTPPFSGTAKQY